MNRGASFRSVAGMSCIERPFLDPSFPLATSDQGPPGSGGSGPMVARRPWLVMVVR